MRVAVVTPYFEEPLALLRRCRDSVAAQTYPDLLHVMVADGAPRPEVDGFGVRHIRLPVRHADWGDTPRVIGALSAFATGSDAVALLDADNRMDADHVARLVARQQETGAQVVTSRRRLLRPDGTLLGDCFESDGEQMADHNCYLLTAPALPVLGACAFKARGQGVVADRVLWQALKTSGLTLAHVAAPTVDYTTLWAGHYLERNEAPPPGARVLTTDGRGSFGTAPYRPA